MREDLMEMGMERNTVSRRDVGDESDSKRVA